MHTFVDSKTLNEIISIFFIILLARRCNILHMSSGFLVINDRLHVFNVCFFLTAVHWELKDYTNISIP